METGLASTTSGRPAAEGYEDDDAPDPVLRQRAPLCGRSRKFAADALLNDLGTEPDGVVLVVSELATNAVEHASGGYEVDLDTSEADVGVRVHDASREPPVVRDVRPHEASGRGLRIVAALSTSWGFERVPGDGKVVRANAPVPGAPAHGSNRSML